MAHQPTACEVCGSTDYEYIDALPTYKNDYPLLICNKCIVQCRRCKQDLHPENRCYACAMGDNWAQCDVCGISLMSVESYMQNNEEQWLCSSCAPLCGSDEDTNTDSDD